MSGEPPSPHAGTPPPGEFRPGEEFAGYRIEAIVGRGGMGVVYRAVELSLQRPVALKVIAPGLVDDALARRRFVREARAAASIEHANVVPVHAAGESHGVGFIAMRLIRGEDLRRIVRSDGPLPPERAAHLVTQVGAALDAAHRAGFVHRDVKPGNILVDEDDHAYLTDFGLTALLDTVSTASGVGQWVGTPDFAAPEQIRGERPDARTDVYALGCVLFFLLTGEPPFRAGGQEAKLWAHLTEPPRSVAPLGGSPFDPVIARALAKRPDDRYASASDLARAARAAAAGETTAPEAGSVAVGPAAGEETVPGEATMAYTREAATVRQPPDEPPSAHRRRRLAGAVALGAALIAVAVVLLTSNNDPGPQTQAETTATPGPTPTVVSMKRVATAAAGNRPTSIALMPRRVWVGERKRPVLRAFEPATLRPLRTAAIPTGVSQLVPSSHGLWATMWRAKAVARLDPRTGRIVGRPISLPGTPSTLAVTGDSLYVGLVAEVTGGFATILKLDRATGAIVWSKQLKRQADRLVWLNGSLWAMVSTPNRLFRIDPDGVIREGFDLPGSDADDLKAAGGWLWATVREPDSLVRIDPRTGQRANTFVGRSPSGLSVQGDDVWVALWYPSRLALVNARTLRKRTRDVDVGLNPFMVASDSTGAWVVCAGGGQVVRVSKR